MKVEKDFTFLEPKKDPISCLSPCRAANKLTLKIVCYRIFSDGGTNEIRYA